MNTLAEGMEALARARAGDSRLVERLDNQQNRAMYCKLFIMLVIAVAATDFIFSLLPTR